MYQIDINLNDNPPESLQRTQQAIDFLGELIFRLRDEVLESQRGLLKNANHRMRLGGVPSKSFNALCDLPNGQKEVVVDVCQQGIDSFTKLLLSYFEHQGSQLRFADNRLAHFLLIMQVVNFDDSNVVEEHHLNRTEGAKFALRWGKWFLNHSKKRNDEPKNDDLA